MQILIIERSKPLFREGTICGKIRKILFRKIYFFRSNSFFKNENKIFFLTVEKLFKTPVAEKLVLKCYANAFSYKI